MSDVYGGTSGPMGTYADVTGVVDATAAAEIVALVAELKSFIPDISAAVSAKHPDFDEIHPSTAEKLRAEIDAAAAAIAAAPTT